MRKPLFLAALAIPVSLLVLSLALSSPHRIPAVEMEEEGEAAAGAGAQARPNAGVRPRCPRRARRRIARRRRAGLAGARDARHRHSLSPRSSARSNGWKLPQGAAGARAAAPGRALGPTYAKGAVQSLSAIARSTTPAPTTSAAEPSPPRSIPTVCAGDCRLWIGQRERRRLVHRRCAWHRSRNGASSPTRSSTTTSRRWRSIRTIRRPTRCGPAPASRTRAAAAARRASACIRRPTAASRGTGRSARREFAGPRGRIDRRTAGQLERGLRRVGPRRARRVEHLLRRRRCADSRRAALRPVSVDGRRREAGQLVNQGAPALCTGVDARPGVAQPDGLLAARRAPRDVRSGGSEHGLRRRSSRAASGGRGISATPGSRSCRASAPPPATPSGPSSTWCSSAARRGCTWASAAAASPRTSVATTRCAPRPPRPCAGELDRPHQHQTAEHARLSPASATATASAATTTTCTSRRARARTRSICSGDNQYNENNYVTGRSNGRAVLLSTNAGVHFTDMTEDASDNFYAVRCTRITTRS